MKPVDRAPVDHVGGPRDNGPWPSDLEEIAVDERLKRPVDLADGSRQSLEVAVTEIQQITRDGEETDGYSVTYRFDDPTLGGGA